MSLFNRFDGLNNMVVDNYPKQRNGRSHLIGGIAALLAMLLILVIAVFAVATYMSADSQMDTSKKNAAYCNDYYAAETAASELLDLLSSGGKVGTADGSKSTYDTAKGKILVTKAENYVSFNVPINKSKQLKVEANINNKKVKIITWSEENIK